MYYNIGNIRFSDELYHYGTKGMHWYERLYQNEDGTLTALGKIHYAAMRSAKAVGNAGAAVGKHAVKKFKEKHPQYMTDAELDAAINRVKKIDTYTKTKQDISNRKMSTKIANIALETMKTGSNKFAENFMSNLGKTAFEKLMMNESQREVEDINNDMKLIKAKHDIREAKFQDEQDKRDLENRRKKYNEDPDAYIEERKEKKGNQQSKNPKQNGKEDTSSVGNAKSEPSNNVYEENKRSQENGKRYLNDYSDTGMSSLINYNDNLKSGREWVRSKTNGTIYVDPTFFLTLPDGTIIPLDNA